MKDENIPIRQLLSAATNLTHYNVDSFATVLDKLHRLMDEEGYDLESAQEGLRRYYERKANA